MGLKFFNTLTRSVQEFVPRDPAGKKVGMYCCGPTVHDFAHIGNYRTFVFADLVRRYLEFKGYQVEHVMNITDVEDKIIQRVHERNIVSNLMEHLPTGEGAFRNQPASRIIIEPVADSALAVPYSKKFQLSDYTRPFEEAFFKDLETLSCRKPHFAPRATEHIGEIISLIEKLIARGVAYKAADGSVYFSIEKYRGCGCRYGQLVKLNFDEMRPGERVSSDEYAKESIADFALWKARVPEDGDVFWPSPWGEGRPGWHIECSAMSMKILGPSFDLHLGGEDLIFPHHEDEIAQSEGAGLQPQGEPFVRYWLHGAFLLVEGKKMSKSLGNFFTLRDLLAKGYTGREIRFLLLTAHYRESFNFTLEGLTGARTSLARLDECLARLREMAGDAMAARDPVLLGKISAALDDDLNVSAAWGGVFEWVRDANRLLAEHRFSSAQAVAALAAWQRIDSVFGIGEKNEAEAPAEIVALLEQRQAARKAKDFKRADAMRDELKAKGWMIEDTPKGPRLKRL